MIIVMEKLTTGFDGLIRVGRKEWNYSQVRGEFAGLGCKGFSLLGLWAMLLGCDMVSVVDGHQVWESSHDSTRIYMEAGE